MQRLMSSPRRALNKRRRIQAREVLNQLRPGWSPTAEQLTFAGDVVGGTVHDLQPFPSRSLFHARNDTRLVRKTGKIAMVRKQSRTGEPPKE